MSVIKITKDNFEEKVLQAQNKVLLDFWATWCGPCRMIAPAVEAVAEEHTHITVGKIDVDEEPTLAAQFGITSIPTLIVMEKGQVTGTRVGLQTKAQIEVLLEV